jgi:hypothetical protein
MKSIVIVADPTIASGTPSEVFAAVERGDAKVVSSVDVDHPPYPREPEQGPSLLTKAVNFATSAAAHIAAGAPRASDAEIERRFAICQGCEFYDGKACTRCGCPVVRESRFVSKLSWANESCPVGKWGKEPQTPVDNP